MNEQTICINCKIENTFQERKKNRGCCKRCNQRFAFEPMQMKTVKVTDMMFKKSIDDLSANNTLFFTHQQFAYFLDKQLRQANIRPGCFNIFYIIYDNYPVGGFLMSNRNSFWSKIFYIFLILFGTSISLVFRLNLPFIFFCFAVHLIFTVQKMVRLYKDSFSEKLDTQGRKLSAGDLKYTGFLIMFYYIIFVAPNLRVTLISAHSFILFAAAVCIGMCAITLGNYRLNAADNITQEFLFESDDLQIWLERWQEIHGDIVTLLPPSPNRLGTKLNPDVQMGSFNRLVVCQSTEIAQMLIANNFHCESNCAVLSIRGYPQDIFNVTIETLRRNVELEVYVLHDCSPQGMGVLQQLKTKERWFKDSNIPIIDVGLTPHQVMSIPDLFIQILPGTAKMSPADAIGLTLDEIAWLEEGKYIELESFTPQQLIQILNRGLAGNLNLLEGIELTGISAINASLYTYDSFS